jgi:hypothetical protein
MDKSIGIGDSVPSTRKRTSMNTIRPGLASAGENLIPSPITTGCAEDRENMRVRKKIDKITDMLKRLIFYPSF